MNLPKTYEDFLKMSDDELMKIADSPLSLKEAQLFISFVNRANDEYIKNKNKITAESQEKLESNKKWILYLKHILRL